MEDTHAYLYNFLSTPNPTFATSDAVSSKHRGSLAESTRSSLLSQVSTQEVIETDNGYFAIFDGHAAGATSSQEQRLHRRYSSLALEDRIPNNTSATGSTAVAPAVAEKVAKSTPTEGTETPPEVVQTVEHEVRKEATRQRVLYTANVGDARIVLCRNGKALRLSYDHKGSDENEGKRIASAGGLILNNRVNGVLAVTRALGDAYMKDLVTGHPYTTETVIQGDIDEFMILACDGVSIFFTKSVDLFPY
ncbi:hypothetical protein MRB53_040002 [Persea americana]|nr:hypothetical protein MRB53_040002 [Persea americana]